jgi:S-adenosylmethionine hydrolase
MARFDTVSFLSDYGLADEFVGLVKAVIRDIAPHATVIDLTHEIPAHDIRAGSLALARCIQYVPQGVVLAVVDPGVGGAGRAVVLTNTDLHLAAPGATFAGRDVFAPVAAHLCNGVAFEALGDPIDAELLVPGVIPVARHEERGLVAEVLWVDRFGNAQLNVGPDDVAAWGDTIRLQWGDSVRSASRVGTFDDIGPGAVGLVLDSYGLLAVALMRQSAAAELGLAAGEIVTLSAIDAAGSADRTTPTHVTLRAH